MLLPCITSSGVVTPALGPPSFAKIRCEAFQPNIRAVAATEGHRQASCACWPSTGCLRPTCQNKPQQPSTRRMQPQSNTELLKCLLVQEQSSLVFAFSEDTCVEPASEHSGAGLVSVVVGASAGIVNGIAASGLDLFRRLTMCCDSFAYSGLASRMVCCSLCQSGPDPTFLQASSFFPKLGDQGPFHGPPSKVAKVAATLAHETSSNTYLDNCKRSFHRRTSVS